MEVSEGQPRRIAGRYALQFPLGEGGMGVVWLAEDGLLQRYVAVKELLLPEGLEEAERPVLRDRLLREARAASRLNHPGATTVYDVVEEDGEAYIVMELVRAPSLLQVVADRGPCAPALTARIGLALLDTLGAAHEAGIVHRDVKPANVLIAPDGAVKLTDFGIATVQGDPALTTSGVVVGSPAYMAPEHARGEPVSAAADVWSLAATLYFAVEGIGPFDRGDTMPTLAAVLQSSPRPPRRAGPLAAALETALIKDPAARATVSELRELLEPVAEVSAGAYGPVLAGPDPPDQDSDDGPSLRDAAGQAAKELGPAVSDLLAQHEARYPALRRVRTLLGEPSAEPPGEQVPQPSLLEGVRERLRQAWVVAKILLAIVIVGVLALIYLGYQLYD